MLTSGIIECLLNYVSPRSRVYSLASVAHRSVHMSPTDPSQNTVSISAPDRPRSPFNFATMTELLDRVKVLSEGVFNIQSGSLEQNACLDCLQEAIESIVLQINSLRNKKET